MKEFFIKLVMRPLVLGGLIGQTISSSKSNSHTPRAASSEERKT
jgi:hypothetical protein